MCSHWFEPKLKFRPTSPEPARELPKIDGGDLLTGARSEGRMGWIASSHASRGVASGRWTGANRASSEYRYVCGSYVEPILRVERRDFVRPERRHASMAKA